MAARLFPQTKFDWSVILILALLLSGAWIAWSRVTIAAPTPAGDLEEAPLPGYRAPLFRLASVTGSQIELTEFAGRPVVLNFWATWCAPCRAEMPDLQRIDQRFRGRAAILGINQGEPPDRVTRFSLELGIAYPLLLDQDQAINRLYRVRALPTTVFIDRHGVVSEVFTGIITEAVIEEKLGRLLADG